MLFSSIPNTKDISNTGRRENKQELVIPFQVARLCVIDGHRDDLILEEQ
jgi:hypothetical protein